MHSQRFAELDGLQKHHKDVKRAPLATNGNICASFKRRVAGEMGCKEQPVPARRMLGTTPLWLRWKAMDAAAQISPSPDPSRKTLKAKLKAFARAFKRELKVYRLVLKDPGTPRLAKLVLGMAVGYVLLPFDLIPDFIPVLGQLDDLAIVPGLVWVALKMTPPGVVERCRQQVTQVTAEAEPLRLERAARDLGARKEQL